MIEVIENAESVADDLKLASLPTDDLGHAERLRQRYGDRIRKTGELGWVCYSDEEGIWIAGVNGEAIVRRYAHQVGRLLWNEYRAAKHAAEAASASKSWEGKPAELMAAIKTACNVSSTNAMLRQAESYLVGKAADFDPDPNLICVRNGTLQPTMINEPCFVAYSDGVAAAYLRASSAHADTPVVLAGWRIRNLSDGVFEIGAPESAAPDAVDLNDLKAPNDEPPRYVSGAHALAHRLYHLDMQLLPHQPSHMITRMANASWDPKAQCPRFRQALAEALPIKQERDYFQRAMGSGLFGIAKEQIYLLLQGVGGDSKSTLMRVITEVAGAYHNVCDPKVFLDVKPRSAAEASPDLANMAGDTRMVYCEEPPAGRGIRLNEALLKQVTGGVHVTARHLHKDEFKYLPRWFPVIAFNELLRIVGTDDGIWRRMRLILFRTKVPGDQIIRGFADILIAKEAAGVLNWLLEGLAMYHRFGLEPFPAMQEAIDAWRNEADTFGDWMRERVDFVSGAVEPTAVLYTDYKDYVERDGLEPMGAQMFRTKLTSRQIMPKKGAKGARLRSGVRLRPIEDWMTPAAKKRESPDGPDYRGER
jgi:P4 family phage/plasmid primase-like protien